MIINYIRTKIRTLIKQELDNTLLYEFNETKDLIDEYHRTQVKHSIDVKELMKQVNIEKSFCNSVVNNMDKQINELNMLLIDVPEHVRTYIDNYVDISIRQVISQGSKCSTKISRKEETFEEKVIQAHGKIKRELPVIKERLTILEDKICKLENVE